MKKKIVETRKIFWDDLRNLCIRNNWYTCGTVKEYEKMLAMCKKDNITTKDIVKIAQDIMEHSNDEENEGRELTSYCFEVARIATTLFEEVEDVDSTIISSRILSGIDL